MVVTAVDTGEADMVATAMTTIEAHPHHRCQRPRPEVAAYRAPHAQV